VEREPGALEGVGVRPRPDCWRGRRVFVTGHTGFKGAWLTLWLRQLGARVAGYALPAPTAPSLFELARVGRDVTSILGDVRDLDSLRREMEGFEPEVVFHLAAQALVRESYADPVGTYSTNVMGTVNVLESVRRCPSVRAAVIVTSDKCYATTGRPEGYRESDPMGGDDPYSSSKGCAELVTSAYRHAYSPRERYSEHRVAIATARAGNVVGGGDWARDRLVPDCLKAFFAGEPVRIRRPNAVRPWQHVLDPLCGYLLLAERLLAGKDGFADAWNFGPPAEEARSVQWVVERLAAAYGRPVQIRYESPDDLHEAPYLALDSAKARVLLGCTPSLALDEALEATVAWFADHYAGHDARDTTMRQIDQFHTTGVAANA
jgi:CDP-glucose 4,6-dehydratase